MLLLKFLSRKISPEKSLDFFKIGHATGVTGQSNHDDLVKKSGLRRILFDKSCLQRILFRKKSGLRRILFIKNPRLNHSGTHFISSFLFCLPIH